MTLEEIKNLNPSEAISKLNDILSIDPDNEEALTLRGMKYWALNQRQLAINDYLASIRLNPDSKAKTALEYANSIMDFYNKDLLNP